MQHFKKIPTTTTTNKLRIKYLLASRIKQARDPKCEKAIKFNVYLYLAIGRECSRMKQVYIQLSSHEYRPRHKHVSIWSCLEFWQYHPPGTPLQPSCIHRAISLNGHVFRFNRKLNNSPAYSLVLLPRATNATSFFRIVNLTQRYLFGALP